MFLTSSLPQQLDSNPSSIQEDLEGWHLNHIQRPSGNPDIKATVTRREPSQDLEKPAELSSGEEEEEEWEQKQSLSQYRWVGAVRALRSTLGDCMTWLSHLCSSALT